MVRLFSGRDGSRRAQMSMEYLAVVGLSLLMIIPMVVLYYRESASLQSDVAASQLEKIGLSLIDAAEEVYYLGPPSQKALVVTFPRGVSSVVVDPELLTFTYMTPDGESVLSFSSSLPLNMSGSLRAFPGPHHILVSANGSFVQLREGGS